MGSRVLLTPPLFPQCWVIDTSYHAVFYMGAGAPNTNKHPSLPPQQSDAMKSACHVAELWRGCHFLFGVELVPGWASTLPLSCTPACTFLLQLWLKIHFPEADSGLPVLKNAETLSVCPSVQCILIPVGQGCARSPEVQDFLCTKATLFISETFCFL